MGKLKMKLKLKIYVDETANENEIEIEIENENEIEIENEIENFTFIFKSLITLCTCILFVKICCHIVDIDMLSLLYAFLCASQASLFVKKSKMDYTQHMSTDRL